MKEKSKRKKLQKGQSELKASKQGAGLESPPPAAQAKLELPPVPTEVEGYPPSEVVAEAARGEPNLRLVEDYSEAITILRDEKRLTFRGIAEWLQKKFGIEADHNAVWRAYTKGADEYQAVMAAVDDERDEQEIAGG
jgi:hypothetical protein